MEKQTYDLILSVGQGCSCSQTLRKAKLQQLSFPFDWLFYTREDGILATNDMPRRVKDLCSGFTNWLCKADIRLFSAPQDGHGQYLYRNCRTSALLVHDFHSPEEFENAFDEVKAKYDRRIGRLLAILNSAKNVLVVRLDAPPGMPPTPTEDCRTSRRMLAERYPKTTFNLIHFKCDAGRKFENRIEKEVEPGLLEVAFDYHDYSPGKPTYEVLLEQTAAVLKNYATLNDYRTFGEKVRWIFRKIFR